MLFLGQIGIVNAALGESLKPECSMENNVNYPAMNIEKTPIDYTDSPIECRALCNENPECKFFSWKSDNLECRLKTGIQERKVEVNYVSGAACRNGKEHYTEGYS